MDSSSSAVWGMLDPPRRTDLENLSSASFSILTREALRFLAFLHFRQMF